MTTVPFCYAAFRPSIDLARAKGGDTVHGLSGIDPQTITVAKLQTHGNKGGPKERRKPRNGESHDEDAAERTAGRASGSGAKMLASLETSQHSGCRPVLK